MPNFFSYREKARFRRRFVFMSNCSFQRAFGKNGGKFCKRSKCAVAVKTETAIATFSESAIPSIPAHTVLYTRVMVRDKFRLVKINKQTPSENPQPPDLASVYKRPGVKMRFSSFLELHGWTWFWEEKNKTKHTSVASTFNILRRKNVRLFGKKKRTVLNAMASAAAHRPFSFVQHKYLYTHLERRKRLRRWVDVKIRHNIPGQSVPSMRPAGQRDAQEKHKHRVCHNALVSPPPPPSPLMLRSATC